jgi:DNA-binding NtrC family response regulator
LAVLKWRTQELFLDEIGDIPLALQPKLLRMLQEREFERLGSGRTHRVNVRVVTATHRDLTEMVRRNEFRCDLYYRLNVFPVVLPPLRERRQDIEPFVSHFVQVFSRRMRKRIDHVPEETLEAFASYWPGNPSFLDKIQWAGASTPGIATNLLPQHRSQRRPTRLPNVPGTDSRSPIPLLNYSGIVFLTQRMTDQWISTFVPDRLALIKW